MTLTDFLLARIAEDEERAEAAAAESGYAWWATFVDGSVVRDDQSKWIIDSGPRLVSYEVTSRAAAEHIGQWFPGRVIEECEAKRRTVMLLSAMRSDLPASAGLGLSALALPYADHPDYREEWRP